MTVVCYELKTWINWMIFKEKNKILSLTQKSLYMPITEEKIGRKWGGGG
jgi:hypothetical protein